MSDKVQYDIAIIGGGIVGVATFYKIQEAYPNLSILLIENVFRLIRAITLANTSSNENGFVT